MVWVNALVLSAGGSILQNNDAGRDANADPRLRLPGRRAAEIIKKLATSKAADPALSNRLTRKPAAALFESPDGGFLLNWPYVYAAIQGNVKDGSVPAAVLDDLGWARYPRVDAEHAQPAPPRWHQPGHQQVQQSPGPRPSRPSSA